MLLLVPFSFSQFPFVTVTTFVFLMLWAMAWGPSDGCRYILKVHFWHGYQLVKLYRFCHSVVMEYCFFYILLSYFCLYNDIHPVINIQPVMNRKTIHLTLCSFSHRRFISLFVFPFLFLLLLGSGGMYFFSVKVVRQAGQLNSGLNNANYYCLFLLSFLSTHICFGQTGPTRFKARTLLGYWIFIFSI